MITRTLNLLQLLTKKSHFLLGPRGTGKTFLIKQQLANSSLYINLLNSDSYLALVSRPAELADILSADKKETGKQRTVVIDEIQKIPLLLDEVHRLIEERGVRFLLTGSSARKLRRGGANLLGGRAWTANLYPLTFHELVDFSLPRYLQYGGLPAVYLSASPAEELQAFVQLYLTEEIAAEGIVRDLPRFSRFLHTAALTNGQLLNFSEIASDLGVAPNTVREYYRILEDTLLGYLVEPKRSHRSRKEISTAKFYFFDVGVTNFLRRVRHIEEGTEYFGHVFEHFIASEIRAALSYQRVHEPLNFWRTHTKQEVDFVVGDLLAVEVKATRSANDRLAADLRSLSTQYKFKHRCLVSRDSVSRISDGVHFIPYHTFLEKLWSGDWFK